MPGARQSPAPPAEIEAQLNRTRLRRPAAGRRPTTRPGWPRATLATTDSAIIAVHRQGDSLGLTLRRDTGAGPGAPARPRRRAGSPGSPPRSRPRRRARRLERPTPFPPAVRPASPCSPLARADDRHALLAFEVKLDPCSGRHRHPLGEHGGNLVLDDGGRVIAGRRQPPASGRHPPAARQQTADVTGRAHAGRAARPARRSASSTPAKPGWPASRLDVGAQRWWIAGFARQGDSRRPAPGQRRPGGPAAPLAALSALLARRFAARSDDGIAGQTDSERLPAPSWRCPARRHRRQAALQERSPTSGSSPMTCSTLPNPVFWDGEPATWAQPGLCGRLRHHAQALVSKTVLELPFVPPGAQRPPPATCSSSPADPRRSHPAPALRRRPPARHLLPRATSAWPMGGRAALGVMVDISSQQEASREARNAETSRRILESAPRHRHQPHRRPALFANSRAAGSPTPTCRSFCPGPP